MAHLKTVRIHRHDEDLDFSYKVSVNTEGLFTTTLPEDISSRLVDAGIALEENRIGKKGFVWAQTLERLREKVGSLIDEYLSRELTESVTVIRYAIETACSYVVDDDGSIVPNGYFKKDVKAGEGCLWSGGSVKQDTFSRHAYGLFVYAVPRQRETFKYKSGKIRVEHNYIDHDRGEDADRPYFSRLQAFNHMSPPTGISKIEDIEYTENVENVARFFYDLILSICTMNERIKDRLSPEHIEAMAESNIKLLTG